MRVILITGSSSGIGAATARAIAAPQTALVLHARKNRSGLEKVTDEAKAAGAESRSFSLPTSGANRRHPSQTSHDFPVIARSSSKL